MCSGVWNDDEECEDGGDNKCRIDAGKSLFQKAPDATGTLRAGSNEEATRDEGRINRYGAAADLSTCKAMERLIKLRTYAHRKRMGVDNEDRECQAKEVEVVLTAIPTVIWAIGLLITTALSNYSETKRRLHTVLLSGMAPKGHSIDAFVALQLVTSSLY